MKAWLVLGALVMSGSALAAPKGKVAKAHFDRGVAAYQKGDFAGASDALGKSYNVEPDIETLFAWAQSERQQNKCESAIELYNKLLLLDMPAENKDVVRAKLDECKAIVAAKTGVLDKPVEDPAKPDPDVAQPDDEPRSVDEDPPPRGPEGRTPWWKDPIGDALTLGGIAGLAVGSVFLYQAKQADDRGRHSTFGDDQATAESKGKIGVIVTITGGVLLIGGIVRYVTRSDGNERTNVSGWVTPEGGGGLAAFGRF